MSDTPELDARAHDLRASTARRSTASRSARCRCSAPAASWPTTAPAVAGSPVPGQGTKFPIVAGVGLVPNDGPVSRVADRLARHRRRSLRGHQDRWARGSAALAARLGRRARPLHDRRAHQRATSPTRRRPRSTTGAPTRAASRSSAAARARAGATAAAQPVLAAARRARARQPARAAAARPGAADVPPPTDARRRRRGRASPPATARFGRATFKWKGGDPAVDAPRGETFVALQRRVGGDVDARSAPTTASATPRRSTTTRASWTETWQFGECDPLGQLPLRGHRRGRQGLGRRAPTRSPPTAVRAHRHWRRSPSTRRTWRAPRPPSSRATPTPARARSALPRRVRTGTATLDVNGQTVQAGLDGDKLRFTRPVPSGATVSVDQVEDGCGNGGDERSAQ